MNNIVFFLRFYVFKVSIINKFAVIGVDETHKCFVICAELLRICPENSVNFIGPFECVFFNIKFPMPDFCKTLGFFQPSFAFFGEFFCFV